MEEMNELFYREPYTREFDAEVIRCTQTKKGYEIVLSDTAFYPEGGGQPADHGTLNGIYVKDTRRVGDEIVHITDAAIPAGPVHGSIDWDRRFDHMQNHTGEHMVSGLIHKNYGYENVGFHMGSIIVLDFDGEITFEMMRDIERQANRMIWKDLPVEITFPDEEELKQLAYRSKKELTGKVRIVTIPDTDVCACCGTHLARTGEVGLIHLLSVQKHGSGSRMEMLAGERALTYLEKIADQNTEISHMLSARPLETAAAVEHLNEQNNHQRYRINELTEAYLVYRTEQLEAQDVCILHEDGLDNTAMRNLANMILEREKAKITAVIARNNDGSYRYLLMSHTADLREAGKKLNSLLNGKGGGKAEMIQGTYREDTDTILNTLQQELSSL